MRLGDAHGTIDSYDLVLKLLLIKLGAHVVVE